MFFRKISLFSLLATLTIGFNYAQTMALDLSEDSANVRQKLNDFISEEESKSERQNNSAKFPICDYFGDDYRHDTCFEIIGERDNKVDFRCTKGVGSQFANLTRTVVLCKNGWESAGATACFGVGQIRDLKKAVNKICYNGY
jgi:hypothetical protein